MNTQTAILFFSRTASAEAENKLLLSARQGRFNKAVLSHLIHRSKKAAKSTGLPVYCITEKQQKGASFGERLANAVESVFSNGHRRVIIIGNDCLSVNRDLLKQSASMLLDNNLVIGPSNNGGLYLIGLTKDCFEKSVFENLMWQSDQLVNNFIQTFGSNIKILDVADDINDQTALLRSLNALSPADSLRLYVYNIISKSDYKVPSVKQFLSLERLYLFGLKAPPAY